MTDRKTIDQITSDQLDQLYNEIDRLHAGEEPGGNPLAEPTPGEWLWQFNRVTADHRLNVIRALLRDSARGRDCFLMNHENRLADERKAWVIVARIRDVIADMESITGARHWARILRRVVNGDEPPPVPDTAAAQATDGTVCDAYRPPATSADSGLCARCGMYDYRHQPGTEAEVERLRAASRVTAHATADLLDEHRRLGIELEHWQTVIVPELKQRAERLAGRLDHTQRTAIENATLYSGAMRDLRTSEQQRNQLAGVLREVLAAFTTARRDDGVIAGHLLEGAIHPDDMDRWTAALPKEPTP